MSDFTIDFHGLIRVTEHGDGCLAREGLFSTRERAGFAVGLERRHDLLGHVLEVRNFIEAHGIPEANQPDLAEDMIVETDWRRSSARS